MVELVFGLKTARQYAASQAPNPLQAYIRLNFTLIAGFSCLSSEMAFQMMSMILLRANNTITIKVNLLLQKNQFLTKAANINNTKEPTVHSI